MSRSSVFRMRILPLAAAIVFVFLGTNAMALFGTNVLFSEVSGTVVLNGKPVEGAKVVQITLWSKAGEVPENSVTTDKNGQFSFPEINRAAGFQTFFRGRSRSSRRSISSLKARNTEAGSIPKPITNEKASAIAPSDLFAT